MTLIAGIFAFFQGLMPMIGWFIVTTAAHYFEVLNNYIPVISLILLCFIGIKMIVDGVKGSEEECVCCRKKIGYGALLMQGVATSLDALSVGFTISEYNAATALARCAVIALLTFGICFVGIAIGKKAGDKLANKAGILGGSILVFIGLEIFVTSLI